MTRQELARDISYARVELGMSREEFMRQTPREWAGIIKYQYDKLPPETKAEIYARNNPQTPEEMMAMLCAIAPKK